MDCRKKLDYALYKKLFLFFNSEEEFWLFNRSKTTWKFLGKLYVPNIAKFEVIPSHCKNIVEILVKKSFAPIQEAS
jgi:hypothetical protein